MEQRYRPSDGALANWSHSWRLTWNIEPVLSRLKTAVNRRLQTISLV